MDFKKIVINSLKLHEFMGATGELFIDFTDSNEIIGKNGSGKSLILNAVAFVFTGRDAFGTKRTFSSVSNSLESFAYVECDCIIDGVDTLIRRVEKIDKKGKVSREIWRNHKEEKLLQWDKNFDSDLILSLINPKYLSSLSANKAKKILLKFLLEKGINAAEILTEIFDEVEDEDWETFEDILEIINMSSEEQSIEDIQEIFETELKTIKSSIKEKESKIKEIDSLEFISGPSLDYLINDFIYADEEEAFDELTTLYLMNSDEKSLENLKEFIDLKVKKTIQQNKHNEYKDQVAQKDILEKEIEALKENQKIAESKVLYVSKFDEKILEKLNIPANLLRLKFTDKYGKPSFNIVYNDVDYFDCSYAEQVRAGITLSDCLMNYLGYQMPIFVDNAECLTELPKVKHAKQIITMSVAKDYDLSIYVGDFIKDIRTLKTMPKVDRKTLIATRIIGTAFDVAE